MRTHRTRASTVCSLVSCVSFLILLSLDAQNTGEHQCARPCPGRLYPCPFDTAGTSRTRASTSVLARFLISLFDTMRTHRTRVSTNVLAHVLDVSTPVP